MKEPLEKRERKKMKLPNAKKISQSDFAHSLKRFANSNFVAKIIIGIVIWVFALIPAWLYFLARVLIDPVGFWQEFALFCVFAIGIGWLQAILVFFGGVLTLAVILDEL